MDIDNLFLHTLDELHQLIGEAETVRVPADPAVLRPRDKMDYYLVRISAELRKLLIDSYPLADRARQGRQVSIWYAPNDVSPDNGRLWLPLDDFDPGTCRGNPVPARFAPNLDDSNAARILICGVTFGPSSPPTPVQPLRLRSDKFLKRPVIVYNGTMFDVHYVIKHLANIEGGVHAGDPDRKDPKSLLLTQLLREPPKLRLSKDGVDITDLALPTRIMLSIGRVVYKGLLPLKEEIER